MKVNVMIGRFPYGRSEDPDVGTWLTKTVCQMKEDERIGEIFYETIDDTPITMTRNKMVELAKKRKADILLMIDNDMSPDLSGLGQRPFWLNAFNFWYDNPHPCIVMSPYCGPPPHCNVYIFRWASLANHDEVGPDAGFALEQFTREEAAQRTGFERVAAGPTGLIFIDMRVFERMKPPYFYYEWTDKTQSAKSSTEDVAFTRDADLVGGCPLYVAWDSWAGHWKRVKVGKPKLIFSEFISDKFKEAAKADIHVDERIMMIGGNGRLSPFKPPIQNPEFAPEFTEDEDACNADPSDRPVAG